MGHGSCCPAIRSTPSLYMLVSSRLLSQLICRLLALHHRRQLPPSALRPTPLPLAITASHLGATDCRAINEKRETTYYGKHTLKAGSDLVFIGFPIAQPISDLSARTWLSAQQRPILSRASRPRALSDHKVDLDHLDLHRRRRASCVPQRYNVARTSCASFGASVLHTPTKRALSLSTPFSEQQSPSLESVLSPKLSISHFQSPEELFTTFPSDNANCSRHLNFIPARSAL